MSAAAEAARPTWFQRFLLPGFAFKAVVIGGGYATGREIAEFFLPAGPWGGLLAMTLATVIWSGVCVATFLFARAVHALDYRTFFRALLGRFWVLFEFAYAFFIVLVLAVFGAAAGEIGRATLDLSPLVGTVALMVGIAGFAAFGDTAVERLFAWVSVLLYGVYAIFLVLALGSFGDRIAAAFSAAGPPAPGWALGGVSYAGYNIVGAVIILPVTRHLLSGRDAVAAGLAAGPLAMLPAFLFFTCMVAFMPGIATEVLPSDVMLERLGQPLFHLLFQIMICAALLESGTGAVHAINERVSTAWAAKRERPLDRRARGLLALALLGLCMLIAERVGLVDLIAKGYRVLAFLLIVLYVLPLLTIGVHRLLRMRRRPQPEFA